MTLLPCGQHQVLDFCHGEPFRYRELLHALAPADACVAHAMHGGQDPTPQFFADRERRPRMLACLDDDLLRIEGIPPADGRAGLIAWCREQAPTSLATSDPDMCDLLADAFPGLKWEQSGQYTVTRDAFRPRLTRIVRCLGPEDRALWDRFAAIHREEPILWPDLGGSGAGVRDFALMEQGLPVDVYVTEGDEDITGVLTVRPLTDFCDEISMVFVDEAHRRLGNGHSLLSQATRDILGRGKQPGYSASGDRVELRRMLTAVGYIFVALLFQAQIKR